MHRPSSSPFHTALCAFFLLSPRASNLRARTLDLEQNAEQQTPKPIAAEVLHA